MRGFLTPDNPELSHLDRGSPPERRPIGTKPRLPATALVLRRRSDHYILGEGP